MRYRAGIASFALTLAILAVIASLDSHDTPQASVALDKNAALAHAKRYSPSRLRQRQIDPAGGKLLLAEGYSSEAVSHSLANSRSPKLEARYDPDGWLETALDLDDLGWLNDERLACAAAYGSEVTDECHLSFQMAVRRTDTRRGEVVATEVNHADFSDLLEADAPPDRCSGLASCLAHARIGATLSLPPGPLDELVGIDDKRVFSWSDADMFDAAHVDKVIEVYEEANEAMERDWDAVERDPTALEIYESNLRRVAHYRRHLERLLATQQ